MSSSDEITFLPLGAILQSFHVAGTNIVQGFPSQSAYASHNSPHFGATIGRVANRIQNATITSLNNGQSYKLGANDGPNNLHGGAKGWGKKTWEGPTPIGVKKEIPGLNEQIHDGGESVVFKIRSEDGDEGFPGTVEASVVYTAGKTAEGKTILAMEYEAKLLDGAEETVINMTNHSCVPPFPPLHVLLNPFSPPPPTNKKQNSYFNLAGAPTIEGTQVRLITNIHLPLDADGIPTSQGPTPFPGIEGSYKPFILGATDPDVDDVFVLNPQDPASVPIDTRASPLNKLVEAFHPDSKIHLEVHSTEPAFQFYTGKYINVPAVEGAPARGARAGFCVEPSRWVNAVNVPEWKDQVVLKKGETYGAIIVYKAWKE